MGFGIMFLLLFIIISFMYKKHSILNCSKMKVDGEYFLIHGALKNNAKAAELMSTINNNVIKLLRYLIKIGEDKKPEVMRLLKRYNWENMFENSPHNIEGSTSYTEGKGKKFVICLRNKKNEFIEINTLMFVVIHELAHLMTEKVDNHNALFWKYMKYLLAHSIKIGIYKYENYMRKPVDYCGLLIYNNPLDMKFD